MTAQPKIAMLAVLFAAMATTAVFNEIAISWYPPTWHGNGQWDYYEPADVRSCMGARLLASAGDNWGASHWYACAQTLKKADALDAFSWRYWARLSFSGFTLLSAFGFAFAVRFDRPQFRVLRGRRLLTGDRARRAFLRATKQEAEHSGTAAGHCDQP